MGHAPVVALLLFWGCCIDTMDQEGRTVLSVAAAQGKSQYLETGRNSLLFFFCLFWCLFSCCCYYYADVETNKGETVVYSSGCSVN